jgi:hypothetical protein
MSRTGRRFASVLVMLTVATVLNLLLVACTAATEPGSAKESEIKNTVPVKIALFQDKSGSAGWSRTPQLTEATLRILIDLVREKTGEIALGLFRDRSNKGLVRLRIDARPEEPQKPAKTRRVYEDARAMRQYRSDMAKYEEALARWGEQADQRIAAFLSEVRLLLEQPADARCTSIWEAINRGDLFLSEDDASWRRGPHKWAVYATDGIHNCGPGSAATLMSGATLIIINGEARTGSLEPLQPKVFESIEAAFRYVSATEGGN